MKMKNIIIIPVKFYQRYISPGLPQSCRYYPTCSNYMLEAVEKFGVIKGTAMGLARILRCHPFAEGGFDRVPDSFTLKRQYDSQNQTVDSEHQQKKEE